MIQMEGEQFRKAIFNGLGRPVLWLREHSWQPYSEWIEHVCLHDTAYDPQCELGRAEYVFEIVKLTQDVEHFANITANGLLQSETHWDTSHLFQLAVLFAKDGHAASRAAVYSRFMQGAGAKDFAGAHEIVTLDGIQGLLFAMDRIGDWMQDHPESGDTDYLLTRAEKECGPAVSVAVEESAKTNVNVRRYLAAVQRPRERFPNTRLAIQSLDYAQLRERLISGDQKLRLGDALMWAKRASANDLRAAAEDLLRETDPDLLRLYLRMFGRNRFPLEPEPLINLVLADDRQIAFVALRPLRLIKHPAVRQLALDLIQQKQHVHDAVALLALNYASGDDLIIQSLLEQPAPEGEAHSLGYDALHVFEENETADAAASLLNIYEETRCSLCRKRAFALSLKRGSAPAWMIQECIYDSDPSTRELARSQF